MSYEPNAHPAQITVLRHLLFTPSASFAEVQKTTAMTSDHFNFHIKKLVDEGYVEKSGIRYSLSSKGKEYANRMDTDENEIEKQPKISAVIIVERTPPTGEREFLFQQRLKNPYFGFWGLPQGKMRWGETVGETAQRELLEETGLTGTPEHRLLYHVRDYDEQTKRLLEDKLFLCTYTSTVNGILTEEFEGGCNAWMTATEFQQQSERFTNVDDIMQLIASGVTFAEREFYYSESEY